MTEPSRRSSRIALAVGLAGALVAAIGGYALGRSTAAAPEAPAPAASPTAPPAARLPSVTALDRGDILNAVAVAADAHAQGKAGTAENAALVGRRFELRLPFGCYGASPEDSPSSLRWSYDAETRTLRVSAAPEVWTGIPWVRALGGEDVEAVEGFWIPRPWTASEACPTAEARAMVPPILPAPQQSVGLAQFFDADSSRVPQRDGKPYETVEKIEPDALQATEGFRLVLSGRIGALPDGQPVGCGSAGAELRPTCLVAVEVNRVAIENPLSGALLAEWNH